MDSKEVGCMVLEIELKQEAAMWKSACVSGLYLAFFTSPHEEGGTNIMFC